MRPDGTHELEFLPAFDVPNNAHTSNQSSFWVQKAVSEIETRVARDPANSNEYFFWSSPDDSAISLFRKDTPRPMPTSGMEAA